MSAETTLVDQLRNVGCDREPFTSDHAKCICRLADEAANEIERLRALYPELVEALEKIATGTYSTFCIPDPGSRAFAQIADAMQEIARAVLAKVKP